MTILAMGVVGRGLVNPAEPIFHADDQGLQRGQAAFETLRVYRGRPFGLHEHLDRLSSSAERIGLPPVSREELETLTQMVVAAAGLEECMLRFYWTGGRNGAGEATAIAIVSQLPEGYEAQRARGIHLIALQLGIAAALRARSPWLLGGVKSTSYAVNMAAEAEAKRRGADDAVFLSSEGYVLEGPVTNVWWRRDATLYTPALELGILAGVTRSQILRSAGELGYEVDEGWFELDALAGAEEAFTSASVREIMPVVRLDDRPLGDGRPGPAAQGLQESLRRAARLAEAAEPSR
jgi:4-amino-4-deoxychorismate lyase